MINLTTDNIKSVCNSKIDGYENMSKQTPENILATPSLSTTALKPTPPFSLRTRPRRTPIQRSMGKLCIHLLQKQNQNPL